MKTLSLSQANSQILLLTFIAGVFCLIPTTTARAESGTCSDHGGVDCSSMADWDGSAVCKDGWRDSSEMFSSMQECKLNQHYCTQTEANQIDLKYDLAGKYKKVSDLSEQLQTLNDQATALANEAQSIPAQEELKAQGRGITTAGLAPIIKAALLQNQIQQSVIASQALTLKSQLRILLGDYWNASNQDTQECWALGNNEYQQRQAGLIRLYAQSLQQSQSIQTTPAPTFVQPSPPVLDSLDYCSEKLGPYGLVSGQSSCGCATGYTLNDAQNYCVPVVNIQKNTISNPKIKPEIKPMVVATTLTTLRATTTALITAQKTPPSITNKTSLIQKVISWFRSLF